MFNIFMVSIPFHYIPVLVSNEKYLIVHTYCCCLKYCNLIEPLYRIMCFLLQCNLTGDIPNYCFHFVVLIPDKNYVILMKIILETVPKYLVEFFKSKWKDAFPNAALEDDISGGSIVMTALVECSENNAAVRETLRQMLHGREPWIEPKLLLRLLFAPPELLGHRLRNDSRMLRNIVSSRSSSVRSYYKGEGLMQMITNGHWNSWDPSVMFLLLLFGPLGLIDNRRPHYERESPFRESENIYRLWVIRNKIFEHCSNMTVSDEEFNSFVNDIKEISENTLDGNAKDEINTIIRCQEPPLLSFELKRRLCSEVEFNNTVIYHSSCLAGQFICMYSLKFVNVLLLNCHYAFKATIFPCLITSLLVLTNV